MASKNRIYWDSCTYLDYLRGDHELHDVMAAFMADWREGKVPMATSALTIAEVLWVRCEEGKARVMFPKAREKELRDLFEPEPPVELTIIEVSRETALKARDLVWKHRVKPKDAIHIAAALEGKCAVMHTNDKALQKLSEKVGGNPILKITKPEWQRQTTLEELEKRGGVASPPSSPAATSPAPGTPGPASP